MANICIFGDSVARGVVIDEIKNKYSFLKENFSYVMTEKNHNAVRNFAKFGCTVSKGLDVIRKKAGSLSNYDYTILEFGGNDAALNWKEVSDSPYMDHSSKVPADTFKTKYADLINQTKKAGTTPVLLTLPPMDSRKYFSWISKDLDQESILEFLDGDVNALAEGHLEYNQMILDLADECNVPVIDIHSEFLKQKDFKSFLCLDGVHPNKAGHELMAKTIESALNC